MDATVTWTKFDDAFSIIGISFDSSVKVTAVYW